MDSLFNNIILACYGLTALLALLMTVRKKWRSPLWLSFFSFFATIVFIDLLLILVQYDPYSIKIRKVYDPVLGVINTPNLHTDVNFSAEKSGDLLGIYGIDPSSLPGLPRNESYDFKYQIDANGFRNTKGKDWKQADLLTIGDSFTIASSLPEEKTWSSLLAAKMGIVSWYEASVNQLGPENYLKILQFFAPGLKAGTKVVIGFFEGNDLHDLYFEMPRQNRKNLALLLDYAVSEFSQSKPFLSKVRIPLFNLAGSTWPVLFFQPYVDQLAQNKDSIRENENYAKLNTIFADYTKICGQYRLNCFIVYFPDKFHVYYPLIKGQFDYAGYFKAITGNGTPAPAPADFDKNLDNEKTLIKTLADENGLQFISVVGDLQKAAGSAIVYWPYDTHLNAYGNEIAAESIKNSLLQTGQKKLAGKP